MSKTILDLCAGLPDTEPELLARAHEFNVALESALGNPHGHLPDYLGSIQAAKSATDAVIAVAAKGTSAK